MTSKNSHETSKAEPEKPVQKSRKGTTETSRLFIDVEGMIRRPQSAPSTRYVE